MLRTGGSTRDVSDRENLHAAYRTQQLDVQNAPQATARFIELHEKVIGTFIEKHHFN
ncbi:IS1 family transposase [Yersinia ruckeri]|uniref:IS1 family transposase n=1 Tax=Yersinia ruckeri TaxID=29486 RepID=UPI003B75CF58